MTDHGTYLEYLQQRSKLALAYRNYWLYPRVCRHLKGRVVDVGCGIGDLLAYRPDTIGVDINPRLIDFCRSRGLEAMHLDSGGLPFAAESFDGAVMDNVLEHVVQPLPLLREISRVLVPRGRLVVGVPGSLGYDSDPDHKVFYDRAGLESCLSDAGFRLLEIFHTPFTWQWLDSRLRIYCLFGVFERRSVLS